MSTANKLTYLNVTKQKLKQAINNIGGEVTDETTFRQYVNQLENAYDRLPKTEFEEGESVTLENTLKGKLDFQDGKVGFGQSEQKTTTGKNKYNFTKDKTTYNNVEYECANTYQFKINGTANANGTTFCNNDCVLPAGDYVFQLKVVSGNIVGSGNIEFIIGNRNGSETYKTLYVTDNSNRSGSFTLASETTIRMRIYVRSGSVFTNAVVNLGVISGTVADHTYEEYSGGYESPSPDWEQEIKYVRGKNRLDENTWEIGTINPSTGQSEPNSWEFRTSGYINVSDVVTLSNYNFSDYTYRGIFEYDSNKNYIKRTNDQVISKTTPFTLNLAPNTRYIRVRYIMDRAITSIPTNMQVQLEQGSTSTPYLPYNTIEETISGKNKLKFKTNGSRTYMGIDITWDNSTLTLNGTSTNTSTYFATGIDLEPLSLVGKYKISGYTRNDNIVQLYWKDKNGTIKYVELKNNPTITFNEGDTLFQIFLFAGTNNIFTFNNETFNLQLEEGESVTSFEPYKTPKTYQFSLGDHKFYGIGTYRDYILRTTGKNLCNGVNQDYWINSAGTQAGKTTGNSGLAIPIKANTTYTISTIASQERYRVGLVSSLPVDNTGVSVYSGQNKDNTSNSITITNTNYQYLIVNATDLTKVQIEEGSTASDYQPFGVGNWYKVGKIGETIYTGASSEDWYYWQGIIYIDNNNIKPIGTGSNYRFMLNYFVSKVGEAYIGHTTMQRLHINLPNVGLNNITNVNEWKNWLSTHNLDFVYICNETYTQITGTLAEQLEEWWNGQSLDGTTIIEGNGDLPMIIKVRGLKGE